MRFEKVSEAEYIRSGLDKLADYDSIRLPARATEFSAGYDFYSPMSFSLLPGQSIKFPTGIRVLLDEDKFLLMAPRSGLGFKYRLQLDNTIGIIDADYSNSDNEGHIQIKITNDSRDGDRLVVNKGEAIAQGIILQYFKTEDDKASGIRNGGFGSTTRLCYGDTIGAPYDNANRVVATSIDKVECLPEAK